MADRAHATAIANLANFRVAQTAKRNQLQAELAEAKAAYEAWCEPKRRYEKLKSLVIDFETQDSSSAATLESRVTAAADHRVREALLDIGRQREQTGLTFKAWGNTNNGPIIAKLNAALDKARDELRLLLSRECDNPAAAVREILSKIPTLKELELSHAV